MTIAELIKKLQTYDSETPVCIPGYEGGLTAIAPDKTRLVYVIKNPTQQFTYYGEYAEAHEPDSIVVLLLNGERHPK